VKYPERVLIVLNPDGTVKAAQMEQLELFENSSSRQHMPEALDAQALSAVLPDVAMLIKQAADLTATVTVLTRERDAAVMRSKALQSRAAELEAAASDLRRTIHTLETRLLLTEEKV
jgi:hypothetical protein